MLLAIDVGNSQVTLGLGAQDGWNHRWRLETHGNGTADEYGVLVSELFGLSDTPLASVTAAVLTCVVPSLTPVFASMVSRLFGREPLVVGPGTRTGMRVLYDSPGALGSDRLVDALAARHQWGAPVVAVDFGTATTFNVVDMHGDFTGGAIAPGVGTAAYALAEAGARLRHVELSVDDQSCVVGRNTEDSMRSGVVYGYADLVAGLLRRFDDEMGIEDPRRMPVVATGGMARVIAPLVERIGAVDPDLTLNGLRLVAEVNGVYP
jgi:type III pantothenate kinase